MERTKFDRGTVRTLRFWDNVIRVCMKTQNAGQIWSIPVETAAMTTIENCVKLTQTTDSEMAAISTKFEIKLSDLARQICRYLSGYQFSLLSRWQLWDQIKNSILFMSTSWQLYCHVYQSVQLTTDWHKRDKFFKLNP